MWGVVMEVLERDRAAHRVCSGVCASAPTQPLLSACEAGCKRSRLLRGSCTSSKLLTSSGLTSDALVYIVCCPVQTT